MSYRVVTATLKNRTALHIGSGAGDDLTDAYLRRDVAGNLFIPGTAIAGALRALLTRLAPRLGGKQCEALQLEKTQTSQKEPLPCRCAVCQLLGDVYPSDVDTEIQATASRVFVFNAKLKSDQKTLFRDGVGIDRRTSAAARAGQVKFDLELLPANAEFDLRMELRGTTPEDEKLLAMGLAEWQAGRLWLGGRVGRGLGAFDVSSGFHWKKQPLDSADALISFLGWDEPWEKAAPGGPPALPNTFADAPDERVITRSWVSGEFTLKASGPLLTNDSVSAVVSGFDHAPLLRQVEGWQKPVLTGAGLRGVLRSQAERIARTLATARAKNAVEFGKICPACDPNVSRGSAEENGQRILPKPLENCDSLLRLEAKKPDTVDVEPEELCLACRLFGSTRYGSRFIVEDAPLIGEPVYKMLDFLAIDRFTGGGSDGAKFDALALWQPAFKVRLFFDNPEAWELGWLALVLRDLRDGWLNVGFGAAKGFGRVTVKDGAVTVGFLNDVDFPHYEHKPDWAGAAKARNNGVFRTVTVTHDKLQTRWGTIVADWVKAFEHLLTTQPRSSDSSMYLPQDTYFRAVDQLYPGRDVLKKEVA